VHRPISEELKEKEQVAIALPQQQATMIQKCMPKGNKVG